MGEDKVREIEGKMAGPLHATINITATGGTRVSTIGSKKGLTLGLVPLHVIKEQ